MEVELIDFKVRILESQHGADAIIRVQIESTDNQIALIAPFVLALEVGGQQERHLDETVFKSR